MQITKKEIIAALIVSTIFITGVIVKFDQSKQNITNGK